MKDYLNTLNEREKWMVLLGGACLFIYVYYALLYAPLARHVVQKNALLIEKINTLKWMNDVKKEDGASHTKQTVDNNQLLTALASQLKNNQTLSFPFQLQQTASGDIQLTFESVPFQAFLAWLAQMNAQYTMTIKQLDAEKTKTQGLTRLMIVLSA